MKTKSLLLFALFVHALIASSLAQVYSVNAVGYVNVKLRPGFNLVANQLVAEDNSIGSVFKNFQSGVPAGTKVFKLVDGRFLTATWDDIDNRFIPDSVAAELTLPGDGVFVYLTGSEEKTLTFVGEVQQGNVCTHIPRGYSIKSNPIPHTLDFELWNFPGAPNDRIFRFNNQTQNFEVTQFDDLDNRWPETTPVIPVGEAFMVFRQGPAVDWCRTFFVNNPN